MLFLPRISRRLGAVVAVLAGVGFSVGFSVGAQAASLDLTDCELIEGRTPPSPQSKAFDAWKTKATAQAQSGHAPSRRLLAAVAVNTLACVEEREGGGGWMVTQSNNLPGSAEQTSGPQSLAAQSAAVAKAARDAITTTHAVGDVDPVYRGMSAALVVKHGEVFAGAQAQAYEDAAAARHYFCALRRPWGRSDIDFSCRRARGATLELSPRVPAERRAAADERAVAWANAVQPMQKD